MLGLESKNVRTTSQCSSNHHPNHHHHPHPNRSLNNHQQQSTTFYTGVKVKTVAQPDLLCDSLLNNSRKKQIIRNSKFSSNASNDLTPLTSPTDQSTIAAIDNRLILLETAAHLPSTNSLVSNNATNHNHNCDSSDHLQNSGQSSPGYFSGHSSLSSSTGSAILPSSNPTTYTNNTIDRNRTTTTSGRQNSLLSSNSSLNSSTCSSTLATTEQNGIMRKSVSEYNYGKIESNGLAYTQSDVCATNNYVLSISSTNDLSHQSNHHRTTMRSAYVSPQQPHQTPDQYRQQQHLISEHCVSHTIAPATNSHMTTCTTQHNPMPGMAHSARQFVPSSSSSSSSFTVQHNPHTISSPLQPPPALVQLPSPSNFTATGVQPLIAIRRVMLLYENLQHEEAANFILRLADQCFPLVAKELPIGLFIEQMPQSLHVLEALYAKLLLSAQTGCCTLTACPVYGSLLKALQPESVTMHLVKLFALRTQTSHVLDQSTATCNGSNGNISNHSSAVLHCTLPAPFQDRLDSNQLLMLTIRKLLRAILIIQPSIRKQLAARKRAIDNAIDALGHHGLVSVSGRAALEALNASCNGNIINNGPIMLSLQEAIRLECEQLVQQQRQVLNKLEQICTGNGCKDGTMNGKNSLKSAVGTSSTKLNSNAGNAGSIATGANGNSLPVSASHQRQLSLRPEEIQTRLLRNRQMLSALEQFGAGQQSLQLLMQMLDARIQYDKETLFQFGQLRKEFNYCCTVSRRLCGALLGNGGVATLDGAHSCTGRLSGHSDQTTRNDSNGTSTGGTSTTTTSSNGQALVTSHVMGCCIESNAVVAPVLMRFSFGCAQVLQLFDQVTTEIPLLKEENGDSTERVNGCAKHGMTDQAISNVDISPAPSAPQPPAPPQVATTNLDIEHRPKSVATNLNESTVALAIEKREDLNQECCKNIESTNNDEPEIDNSAFNQSSSSSPNVPCAVLVDVNSSLVTSDRTCETNHGHTKSNDSVSIKGSIWTQQVRLQTSSSSSSSPPPPPPLPPSSSSSNHLPSCTQMLSPQPTSLLSSSNLTERLQQAESRIQQLEHIESELRHQLQQQNSSCQQSTEQLDPLSLLLPCSKTTTTKTTTAASDALDRLDLTQSTLSNLTLTNKQPSLLNKDHPNSSNLLGKQRPIALIRRYGDLYAQARVDTLDALNRMAQLKQADELKCKLLFSVLVLSFRCVQKSITQLKQSIFALLQIRSFNKSDADVDRDAVCREAILNLEQAINDYLRDCGDQFDLEPRVQDVFTQICSTLFDYPCLRNCSDLLTYVRDCVHMAWAFSTHTPAYVIRFDSTTFDPVLHIRFHTSDVNNERIVCHVWPALLEEGINGGCVYKGVVIT